MARIKKLSKLKTSDFNQGNHGSSYCSNAGVYVGYCCTFKKDKVIHPLQPTREMEDQYAYLIYKYKGRTYTVFAKYLGCIMEGKFKHKHHFVEDNFHRDHHYLLFKDILKFGGKTFNPIQKAEGKTQNS
jgi:hypothetical protein